MLHQVNHTYTSDADIEALAPDMFKHVNTCGDGRMSFEELKQAVIDTDLQIQDNHLRMALDLFDHERKGGLDIANFTSMLKALLPSHGEDNQPVGPEGSKRLWRKLKVFTKVSCSIVRRVRYELPSPDMVWWHRRCRPLSDSKRAEARKSLLLLRAQCLSGLCLLHRNGVSDSVLECVFKCSMSSTLLQIVFVLQSPSSNLLLCNYCVRPSDFLPLPRAARRAPNAPKSRRSRQRLFAPSAPTAGTCAKPNFPARQENMMCSLCCREAGTTDSSRLIFQAAQLHGTEICGRSAHPTKPTK
mmetsp:Transcript_19854/g.47333  ORF Transcript_19854/g.47333 Transcript_19854/m.47333 type:complete len:300 (+) Transcript_19854:3-902(+)